MPADESNIDDRSQASASDARHPSAEVFAFDYTKLNPNPISGPRRNALSGMWAWILLPDTVILLCSMFGPPLVFWCSLVGWCIMVAVFAMVASSEAGRLPGGEGKRPPRTGADFLADPALDF